MRIIKTKSYEEMSALATGILGAQVLLKPACVLGLATGSSPIGAYEGLVREHGKGLLDFSLVRTVNLDEYCGLNPTDPQVSSVNLDEYKGLSGDNDQSYRYFMEDRLFGKVNIKKENTFLPDGCALDMAAECRRYEGLVNSLQVDLQLLGIGHNGHIGFNEPAESFPCQVHQVALAQSTIQANSRLFERVEDVPTQAVTMGIGTIMKAKRILLIAGPDKAEIVERSMFGPITPQVPASVLQLHPDVTVILSEG